jgi:hypothetical protein
MISLELMRDPVVTMSGRTYSDRRVDATCVWLNLDTPATTSSSNKKADAALMVALPKEGGMVLRPEGTKCQDSVML